MAGSHTIVAVNPGSTSTKVAISVDGVITGRETFRHDASVLGKFATIWDQFDARLSLCTTWAAPRMATWSAVISLGGLLKPVCGGVYTVNDRMLEDARGNVQGEHASNLGCALADAMAKSWKCPAYVADPVSVDEFGPLAVYSGHPAVKRRSLSHALNIHAAARRAAAELSIPLEASSLVVCHLGGGISVAPVLGGRIVDVNDAASDGPFSPERTGGLPLQAVIDLCFSGKHTEREMRSMVMGRGGLVAYLGTNSVAEAEQRAASGDTLAIEVLNAMAYQIAKEIGAMATVLRGTVHAVVLTGGAARSAMLTAAIGDRVRWIGRIIIDMHEDEMQALVDAAMRILRGGEQLQEYPS